MPVFWKLSEYRSKRKLAGKISEKEAYEKLDEYYDKLERGELLNVEEIYTLHRIERLAKRKRNEELKNEVDNVYSKLAEVTRELAFREGESVEVVDAEFGKRYKKDDITITYTRIKLK